MANYSQRYASGDSNTAGAFTFDTNVAGNDVPVTKIMFGADAADPTRVTATVGLPITILAGTASIGKLAANSGIDIGDVDITSIAAGDNNIGNVDIVTVPADPFGANADAASATGSISAKLRFIASTGIPITGTVTVGSHAVTNAGTFAVQAAQSGTWTVQPGNTANTTAWLVTGTGGTFPVTDSGGSLTVDAPVGTPVFVRLSDGTSAITALPVTDNGGALTIDDGGSTISIDDGAGSLTVDGTVGISGTVTVGTHDVGTVTTVTTVSTVTTVTTCSTVTTLTGSGVAHDAADSGNPHKIGAKATTSLSGVTLVADADRTDARSAADGALLVRDVCLEDVVQERTTNTDGASTAFASGLAAPGAGVRLWITSVDICNSSASFCTVDLRDGAAGAVLWTLPVPATGGVVKRFDPPLKLTANTALAFDASAATTTLTISANGFKSKL